MFLIKPILDLIFFKNPLLIMVFSFAILSLAGLLDGRTGIVYKKTQLAIKNGPPEVVRIEKFSKENNSGIVGEMNVLAEIAPTDLFKITIDKKGAVKNTKYILPLYVATPASSSSTNTNNNNNTSMKTLIGALVSDDEDLYNKALTLSDANGQIGPIVKVNGLQTSFGTEYQALAKDNLAKLGIQYGYYGNNPIYIEAFFGNRNAILTDKTATGIQSDIIYYIAYLLIAIAYYRSVAQIISIAKGTKDPSIINAIITKLGMEPTTTSSRSTSKLSKITKPVSKVLNITPNKASPFKRLDHIIEDKALSDETTHPRKNSVFLREVRKA
jgi:hypothetical protein